MSRERDLHLLRQAAHEAARAEWLWTAPNPRVGALALADGHVIGRGRHRAWGGPHAEEAALRDAGAWDPRRNRPVPGVVDEMVVTLEPCSARDGGKKRPPCVDLLRAAGVRKLLVGAVDPDPRHRGAGCDLLRATGLELRVAREGGERLLREANGAFLASLEHPERPWVLLKWAASVDGKTASEEGESRWITGPTARAEVHRLRALGDAILVGPGTLRRDDPRLDARPPEGPPAHPPLRVLLLPDGRLDPGARILDAPGARIWLLAEGREPAPDLAARFDPSLDRVWQVPVQGSGHLDLRRILERLRGEIGVHRLFVEGGPRLQGRLLSTGLADAVLRYEAPILLGGSHGSLLGPHSWPPDRAPRLCDEERADLPPDLRRAFRIQS